MKKLESLNNEKFAALQSSEISNLAAVVGGDCKPTVHAGGRKDIMCQTCDGSDIEETLL